jgi:hypothetical protein
MTINHHNPIPRLAAWLTTLTCSLLLAACGGGGGSPGTTGGGSGGGGGGTTAPSASVVVTLVNASGQSSNVVSSATPLTAKALVSDKAGTPIANAVVAFSADASLVLMAPSAGTALTDSSGVATVTLRPTSASVSGASKLTASVTLSGGTFSGETTFAVAATVTAAPTVALSFVNSAGQPTSSVTVSSPLTARALVADPAGKPVVNALVAFSADNALAVFSPSTGTALTDANGLATVSLTPASLAASGAGKVSASVTVAGTTVVGEANFVVGATALTLSPLSLSPATIPAYGSSIVTIDVLASGVKYTDQQLSINFTSGCVAAGKATFATTVPTNNGTAQAVYRDQGCASNDVISASVDGVSKASSATLTIGVPTAASIQFSSAEPTDRSIVIKGQGGISRTETATLKFKVFDTFNNPLPRQNVRFSTVSTDVTLNKLSDSTDANGEVITTVNSGSRPTTFRVQAMLDSGVFTTSDSIVVTTGLPVQKAFSLSVTTPNVEGWTYDSGTTVPATLVNVLLADQFGNPVPDGAPVVFQTNLGAVGSSSKGACNTVNGGCSVDFRTQDPRGVSNNSPSTPCNNMGQGGVNANDSTRPGVATICASSTDGSSTVFKKTAIFFSGSAAVNVYLDGSAARLNGSVVDLGSVGATDSKVFSLLISDVNFNPMPAGSKVEITDITNGNASGVSPVTVQSIFPHSSAGDDPSGNVISGNQGSYHTITVGSVQPKPCLGPLVSTFNVSVTTPRLKTTSYPFKVRFSCP